GRRLRSAAPALPLREWWMRRAPLALLFVVLVLAGCSSTSHVSAPTIPPALTFQLTGFEPAQRVQPGRPTTLAFTIDQPSGAPLTRYRRGPGPHTGVHLIVVREDLAGPMIHHHPPVGTDGHVSDRMTFATPGRYRVLIDVYPASGPQRNFQLFRTIEVAGAYNPPPIP